MTVSLKHFFQSAKGDGPDTTRVQPSNWNAEHTFTLATSKVLGRTTAGTGAVEELPLGATGLALLAAATGADVAAVSMEVGDIKLAFATGAKTGFVRANGRTIGDATSGGTERANADTSALFTHLWNNFSNTICPVSSGRGANAAADFAAHKNITLPDARGRVPTGMDDMGNSAAGRVTGATTLGDFGGSETRIISQANLPAVQIGVGVSGATSAELQAHNHYYNMPGTGGTDPRWAGNSGGNMGMFFNTLSGTENQEHAHTITGTGLTNPLGSGSAFNILQPFILVTVYIKM